jgi:cytochrome c biogenesis protein CcmG/thiol:disulfide interchange protein DsbE
MWTAMLRQALSNRWLRALAVAAAVAMWPACSQPHDEVTGNGEAPAPAPLKFSLKDMNGNDVALADYRGRPLIVNFWAIWCPPCKVEIPYFIEYTEKYKAQRLTVLGISIDDTPEDLRTFATEYKMNYPVLVGNSHFELQEAFDADIAIPVTWFIRADGTVFLKHQGPASKEWFDRQVEALLAASAQGTR